MRRPGPNAVLRELPALRRFALSLSRDPVQAEDLVQETVTRGLGALAALRAPDRLRPWLFAILHNEWRRHAARTARQREIDPDADPAVPPPQHATVLQAQVLAALSRLPEEQAVVIRLVSVEDLTYQEVADLLGVPLGTVMSRLSRGRARLRELVDGATVVPFRRPA